MKKRRLITSALPYVNNIPHLGNIIGCVLSADVFARYCRIAGYETLYVCGTDEYGTTTVTRAKAEGISPKELCDKYHEIHKDIYDWFRIDFSHFGRTSCDEQTEIVQEIFKNVYDNGYITRDKLVQPYCEHDDIFLADRYIEGVCPHCGYENAKGDQCESCGKLLNPEELKSPKCALCGNTPEFRETEHLFLDLEKLKPELEAWFDEASKKGGWSNNAIKITKGWLEQGLKKRCITRDLSWGVKVPLQGFESKVFYVWFDAPIGYISITANKYDNWKDWWQSDDVDLYQFMGKDNIPFHTVLFPSSLIATKQKWTMLHNISSTEYLNYENMKFSKSRGTGVFGNHAKETGIDADLFRYYLLRNRPEKNDTLFYWNDFMEKANGEIIGNYGNLVNRVLQFTNRFFDSKIPEFKIQDNEFLIDIDFKNKVSEIIDLFEAVELKKSLLTILELTSLGNKYFQDSQSWALIKEDSQKAGEIIGTLIAFIKDVTILLAPFIPATTEKVFSTLNLDLSEMSLNSLNNYGSLIGKEINKAEVLFKKLEAKQIEKLRERFSGNNDNTTEDTAEEIPSFSTLNLRVGKIIEVKKHPEADKLYVEKVDLGNGETRQIVSGLVAYYTEEELLGKKIIVAYNLKSAKLRGVLSEGMLLAAETRKKKTVEVISPDEPVGSVVKVGDSVPNSETITIEDFFSVPMRVENYEVLFNGEPLTINGNKISVENVEKGKVG